MIDDLYCIQACSGVGITHGNVDAHGVGLGDGEDSALRSAHFHQRQIELVWRDCLFFNQTKFLFDEDDNIRRKML